MSEEKGNYTGSCLCGQVQYQVSKFLPVIAHCHCTMCQKFHGAAFSTFGEVEKENLHWLSGQEHLTSYRAENGSIRQFCNCCGASMAFISRYNEEAATVEIAIATLDSGPPLTPDAHIFTRSKVPWITLSDDLPKFTAFRKPSPPDDNLG